MKWGIDFVLVHVFLSRSLFAASGFDGDENDALPGETKGMPVAGKLMIPTPTNKQIRRL